MFRRRRLRDFGLLHLDDAGQLIDRQLELLVVVVVHHGETLSVVRVRVLGGFHHVVIIVQRHGVKAKLRQVVFCDRGSVIVPLRLGERRVGVAGSWCAVGRLGGQDLGSEHYRFPQMFPKHFPKECVKTV